MFIIKNALKCIGRSKGRNCLIGICGIYELESNNEFSGAAFGLNQDPANKIYMSAAALEKVMKASEEVSQTTTNEETQEEIIALFRELANQGKCVILVSHSPAVAALCDVKYELTKISKK